MSFEYLDLADDVGIAAEITGLDDAIVVKVASASVFPDIERLGVDGYPTVDDAESADATHLTSSDSRSRRFGGPLVLVLDKRRAFEF